MRLESQRSFETVRYLREKIPGMRVLILSGEWHPHFYYMSLKSGAHGIASKVDNLKDFERIVRRIMNGETRVLSERMKMVLDDYLVDPPPELTAFEIRIWELVQEGRTNDKIAYQLQRSRHTIKNALNTINQKLGTRDRINAYERAEEMGLIGWRW